jgi:hypothetical protein
VGTNRKGGGGWGREGEGRGIFVAQRLKQSGRHYGVRVNIFLTSCFGTDTAFRYILLYWNEETSLLKTLDRF